MDNKLHTRVMYLDDATYLVRNGDGSFSVVDNGEEIDGLTAVEALVVALENLKATSDC